ncbi:hypothetical protein D1818_22460 [Aquimarina sp. BL5]|uniref:hypothetical protein n=1 Tax=Aquimarina sp. BL5 TaxID=1714860 RepID=UPI000E487362|nr:hypothetical protein [Aquimarina sp. BL5]AXT53454.1 hypothetical protein D1818_22460 [Aquimarina sp. BL5]RKM92728.1 hypothetical protein D7036_22700 [Aquimarina sp. BL5]
MTDIKYIIEFLQELSAIINDFVINFKELYVHTELVNRKHSKKIRLTFVTDQEMKEYFVYKLNRRIKQCK